MEHYPSIPSHRRRDERVWCEGRGSGDTVM
jgi:hypothetical protein